MTEAAERVSGTSLLAWRNLSHDRARFVVTLVGVLFAVLLMGVELGLLLGFARTTSGLVDHTTADLWITPAGTTNVDIAGRLDERRRFEAMSVPGVAQVDRLMMQFAFWRKPDGGTESVSMVGFNLANGQGAPWNLVKGSIADLQQDDAVIIDTLYARKLGVTALGQTVEINNRRARVVGFTQGIRTFTQSPYVFTIHRNAQNFTFFRPDETTYLLVKLRPGADVEATRLALQARLGRVDVWRAADFAAQAQRYWLVTTGAGSALLLAALLGLVVGIVIVGQTLYATTVDRLPEYATLRAMGAPNRYLYAVILKQAAISAVFGFAGGMLMVWLVMLASAGSTVAVAMPPGLIGVLALLTAGMCALGALVSIRRVMRIDPTSVFQ
ncbi:putative ABC transport system permease protein [Tahibacter aquaticus]|uniref:Putative ABC transport system permease protein n=1 Tax=Tahibacter aquaticus TaxID=520092 RepID=A0A4R6YSL5_9GAMM|nr:ABC transporter permease [Tahibacter aquaticus]TDR41210.1 putative ABC transport system permease protein [Tahibacter aquaticus]